jgi:hypothetical protein
VKSHSEKVALRQQSTQRLIALSIHCRSGPNLPLDEFFRHVITSFVISRVQLTKEGDEMAQNSDSIYGNYEVIYELMMTLTGNCVIMMGFVVRWRKMLV